MAGDRKSVRVTISGRVQGVWYRGWTVADANRRGLDGWVRNRRDGTVEAVFAGDAAAVEAMLTACRQGPPAAQVTGVEATDTPDPGPIGFEQRDTV